MKYYPGFSRFGLFGKDLFSDDFFSNSDYNFGVLKTDIHEKEGFYELDMEAPGYTKDDIQIELKNGYLMIKVEKNTNKEEKDENGRIIRQERYTGSCSRNFFVGENVHQEDIKATFDNGELKITVPKDAPKAIEEKKLIQIQ